MASCRQEMWRRLRPRPDRSAVRSRRLPEVQLADPSNELTPTDSGQGIRDLFWQAPGSRRWVMSYRLSTWSLPASKRVGFAGTQGGVSCLSWPSGQHPQGQLRTVTNVGCSRIAGSRHRHGESGIDAGHLATSCAGALFARVRHCDYWETFWPPTRSDSVTCSASSTSNSVRS